MSNKSAVKLIRYIPIPVALIVVLVSIAGLVSAGTITNSAHDFSSSNADQQICVNCHTPHNSDITVATAPLWNHDVTTGPFQPYASPTMNAIPGDPTGSSLLCLSCHDGTVAIDSFGGNIGGNFMQPGDHEFIGTDLRDDHPISFTYDTALANADPGLNDPAATTVTIGLGSDKTNTGLLSDLMLPADQVQCSSCHDVHNGFVPPTDEASLLLITKQNSSICLTCHNK